MGVPSGTLLSEQLSIDFAARKRLRYDRDMEWRRKREEDMGIGR